MHTKRTLFTILFLGLLNLAQAQVIGKIFTKDYADANFGEVQRSITILNNTLNYLLDQAGEYIMFNIDDGTLRALNGNRRLIIGNTVSTDEVFYKMSTSQVKLLLQKGEKTITAVEMRPKTLTLTNGGFTLELVWPCPPNCDGI